MLNKFKLGTKVFFGKDHDYDDDEFFKLDSSFNDDYHSVAEAIITREVENNLVLISTNFSDKDFEIETDLLLSEEEYKEFLNLKSAFEKDLSDKLNKAAELISEAQALTMNYKQCNLSEMYDLVFPLLKAMDNIGWNTSSLGC